MKGWEEIFRTGVHIDSAGRGREFTTADLDRIVSSYDPTQHEAPVVVGHPKDNAPAYGWVESLQRAGEVLLAKFHQVAPEFVEMVQAGRFKKRSISLYPDGTLRHVGFLGAQPPAVKGLRDIAFGDDDQALSFEFVENHTKGDQMTVEQLQKQLADEQAARAKAEKTASDALAKAERATNDFAEAKKQAQRQAIVDCVESGVRDGKLLPAWKEKGLVDFMVALENQGGEYQFSEGSKQSPAQWFKGFLSEFTAHPLFREFTQAQQNNATGGQTSFDPSLTSHV